MLGSSSGPAPKAKGKAKAKADPKAKAEPKPTMPKPDPQAQEGPKLNAETIALNSYLNTGLKAQSGTWLANFEKLVVVHKVEPSTQIVKWRFVHYMRSLAADGKHEDMVMIVSKKSTLGPDSEHIDRNRLYELMTPDEKDDTIARAVLTPLVNDLLNNFKNDEGNVTLGPISTVWLTRDFDAGELPVDTLEALTNVRVILRYANGSAVESPPPEDLVKAMNWMVEPHVSKKEIEINELSASVPVATLSLSSEIRKWFAVFQHDKCRSSPIAMHVQRLRLPVLSHVVMMKKVAELMDLKIAGKWKDLLDALHSLAGPPCVIRAFCLHCLIFNPLKAP